MAQSASDWAYTVSEAVASYTLTGMIGFVVVKKLKLQDRVADVPWRTIWLGIPLIIGGLGLGLWFGSLLGSATAR